MSAVRRMIQKRLRFGVPGDQQILSGAHLDEDALNAFTEGRLAEIESAPLIKHLISCAFCRHITAQLVRLESEIEADHAPTTATSNNEPGRIRRLLEELSAHVMPASEDESVFAYHAPAEDFERKNKSTNNDEAAGQEVDPEK